MHRLTRFVLVAPVLSAALLVAATAAFMVGATRVQREFGYRTLLGPEYPAIVELEAFVARYGRNTGFANLFGLCAVSLPCSFTDQGLPVGLMIMAKPFREDIALQVAYAYEQATPWHRRRPDLAWVG